MVFAALYQFGLKSDVGADTLSHFFKMVRVDTHVGNNRSILLSCVRNAEGDTPTCVSTRTILKKCDKVSAPTSDFNPNWYKAAKTINLNQALPEYRAEILEDQNGNQTVADFPATNLRRDKIQGQLLNSCIIKLMNKKTIDSIFTAAFLK
jgi:hypothetical protein